MQLFLLLFLLAVKVRSSDSSDYESDNKSVAQATTLINSTAQFLRSSSSVVTTAIHVSKRVGSGTVNLSVQTFSVICALFVSSFKMLTGQNGNRGS